MKSPKGRFRMAVPLVIVVALFLALYPRADFILADNRLQEWLFKVASAIVMNIGFYWGMRVWVMHSRTHELPDIHMANRQNSQLISHALVTIAGFSV